MGTALLCALLVMAVGVGVAPPAFAQEAPSDRSAQSSEPVLAHVESAPVDAETRGLVESAADLIRKRAEGDISFNTYRRGVLTYQRNHPLFYGAFFGDPDYYDARYANVIWMRELVNYELHPLRPGIGPAFFCDPYAYDPYLVQFGPVSACRGPAFAVNEFFGLPAFLHGASTAASASARIPPLPLMALEPHGEEDTWIAHGDPDGRRRGDERHHSAHRPDREAPAPPRDQETPPREREEQSAQRDLREADRPHVVDIPSRASDVRPAPDYPQASRRGLTGAEIRQRIRASRAHTQSLRESNRSGIRHAPSPRNGGSGRRGRAARANTTDRHRATRSDRPHHRSGRRSARSRRDHSDHDRRGSRGGERPHRYESETDREDDRGDS